MNQDSPKELIKDIEDNYFNEKLGGAKTIVEKQLNSLGIREGFWSADWKDHINAADPDKDKADFEAKRGEILTCIAKAVIEIIIQEIKTEADAGEIEKWKNTLKDYIARNRSSEELAVYGAYDYKKLIDDINAVGVVKTTSGWEKVGFHQKFYGDKDDPNWAKVGFCLKFWG